MGHLAKFEQLLFWAKYKLVLSIIPIIPNNSSPITKTKNTSNGVLLTLLAYIFGCKTRLSSILTDSNPMIVITIFHSNCVSAPDISEDTIPNKIAKIKAIKGPKYGIILNNPAKMLLK